MTTGVTILATERPRLIMTWLATLSGRRHKLRSNSQAGKRGHPRREVPLFVFPTRFPAAGVPLPAPAYPVRTAPSSHNPSHAHLYSGLSQGLTQGRHCPPTVSPLLRLPVASYGPLRQAQCANHPPFLPTRATKRPAEGLWCGLTGIVACP